jgi:creatinine amidohydrolase
MNQQASIRYGDHRWPELKALAEKGAIILLPVGQTEEHGPHMPVDTDVRIAEETARAVAEAVVAEVPVLVLPTIWCGYSGRGLFDWPGVISMPPEVVISVVENIGLSLGESGFRKIVILNSHGHHPAILQVAARKVADQSEVVMICTDIFKMASESVAQVRESGLGGCCHACEYETSLMLHFGARVDMTAAVDEPVKSRSSFVSGDMCAPGSKVFWSTWRYQKSETGTYGTPSVATAEKGAVIFKATVDLYVKLLKEVYAAP